MTWYVEHFNDRWIVRSSGNYGGLAILPALYRDELTARMRAAELNRREVAVLASFDGETQMERALFDWAIERYDWRLEGEFEPEGFADEEAYQADLRAVRDGGEEREALLDSFQEWLEHRHVEAK